MNLKAEFENLDAAKSLVIGLILGGLYYLFMFDSGVAIDAEITRQRQTIEENRANLERVRQAIKDKERYGREIKEINRNMRDFLDYFTPLMGNIELSSEFTKRADQFKVVVNNLKPVDKRAEFPGYIETAVEFEVEGDFDEVMKFIASLTTMKRAIDFSSMEFKTKAKNSGQVVVLKTTLVVYSVKNSSGGDNA